MADVVYILFEFRLINVRVWTFLTVCNGRIDLREVFLSVEASGINLRLKNVIEKICIRLKYVHPYATTQIKHCFYKQ